MVLTLLGSLIYFLIFPYKFDPTLSEYLIATGGVAAYAQIAATMDMRVYFVVMLIQILFASFINAPFALGEEAGWRGYMYPALKQRFGVTKGRIIGGLVWGSWHWPVMILTGYEYGWSVFNAPWYLVIAGLLLFPVFTVSIGIMLDWLYEKTGSIWSTALFHGAINTCNFCMVLLKVEYAGDMYLGPHPIGIISGLPFLIIATIICVKSARKN